ncbi:formyltransferase family protein [Microbacterium sp. zg-YB36]|uniref:methionyl-tRNA formyltransferase n=1 Tax=Microbacterium sp. zg-YB36 TaxID=2969407 RepID=UPI00214BA283|nr:formyltransferase family protein [Microbacterium sp. zg-YB36]MDL5352360.1 formyltransferase family protein [Microbacterium sp. zg-YB36]
MLIGDGPTGESAFRGLVENFPVVGVVRNVGPTDAGADPVLALARANGCETASAAHVGELEPFLERVGADLVVMSSYSRIVQRSALEGRPYVNVHYSPLPAYRGRANVNWAIINGEDEAAITVHSVVPGLDAGPVLAQRRVPIGPRDTVTHVYAQLNALQETMLAGAVHRRWRGELGDAQDETAATYCCGRNPEDGLIDWSQSTVSIDRLIRALTDPFPGAFSYLGRTRIGIDWAAPVVDPPRFVGRIPGRVVNVSRSEGSVDVLTGDGILRIDTVRVGGESARASDVIRTVRATLGLSHLTLLALNEG